MVIGQATAAQRLKAKHIFCRDLSRIIASAKIRVFALDKTGTITRQGLRFAGVQPISNAKFSRVSLEYHNLPVMVRIGLASAHTLSPLGPHELVGHSVDKEMFAFTNFTIRRAETANDGSTHPDGHVVLSSPSHVIDVIRTLEFESSLMRMLSVIRVRDTNEVFVLCKGSYESIAKLLDEELLPPTYSETAINHARTGCYTLALSYRSLGTVTNSSVNNMSRTELESSMEPLALLLFQNEVRPDSANAIDSLKRADVRTVMLTGDNVYTGVYAARESGMISGEDDVILADVAEESKQHHGAGSNFSNGGARVEFTNMSTGERVGIWRRVNELAQEQGMAIEVVIMEMESNSWRRWVVDMGHG